MITIFDIPLLMDQICRHLSPLQIRRCLRVCKAWAVAFNPYQWDHVSLLRKSNGGSLIEDLSEAEKELLVQNVYWIRSLRVHFSEELLNVPDCVNLRAVSFRDLDDFLDNRDASARSYGYWDQLTYDGHWQHWNVFTMLARNRQLEELEIQYVDHCPEFLRLLTEYLASVERGGASRPPNMIQDKKTKVSGKGEDPSRITIPTAVTTASIAKGKILEERRTRKKLQKLSLRVPIELDPPKLYDFMQWLPRTLTSLSLRQVNDYYSCSPEELKDFDPLKEDDKVSFRIQSYKVYGFSSLMIEAFSIWLITRSPELRELRLPTLTDSRKVAPTLFRTLSRALNQTHPLDLSLDADYLPLPGEKEARARDPKTRQISHRHYPCECQHFDHLTIPLRSLTIDVYDDHNKVFETLARYSGKTLRELKIMGCQPIGDIDMYYVIKDCLPLKRVHYWIGDPDGQDPYIHGAAEDSRPEGNRDFE